MSAAERRRYAIFEQDSNPLSPKSTHKIKKNIKDEKKIEKNGLDKARTTKLCMRDECLASVPRSQSLKLFKNR